MKSLNTCLLFSIILISISFTAYGPGRYIVEKKWVFESINGKIGELELHGYFVANNSYQKATILSLSPGLKLFQTKDGILNVSYSDKVNKKKIELKAIAIVDVEYSPEIKNDWVFKVKELPYSELTEPTPEIISKAKTLVDSQSMLSSVRNLTDFVHGHITYDAGYLGKDMTMEQIYQEKRGVCEHYAHLFVSMSRAVGIDSSYVYGYTRTNKSTFEPHAWAVVNIPGYEPLPVDPTYYEIGTLENTHIIATYAPDNYWAGEYFITDPSVKYNSSVNVTTVYFTNSTEPLLDAECSFDEAGRIAAVNLKNPKNNYLFFVYNAFLPGNSTNYTTQLLLLKPFSEKQFSYGFNSTLLKPNLIYTINPVLKVNDQFVCSDFVIKLGAQNHNYGGYNYTLNDSEDINKIIEDIKKQYDDDSSECCLIPAFVMLMIFGAAVLRPNGSNG